MYKDYFGLKEEPFSISPDPQFLYMSERHREALAHLIYGMKADSGFVLLTGEVGTGKTTVCRCLLGQIPENSEIAFILNPRLSVVELLATICDELRIPYPEGNSSIKVFIDLINSYLLDAHGQGKQTILIIDEAQNLRVDVLEQIRLLTNLETDKRKLLQVIMLGQPELNHLLERLELRQLAQRITARYHLEPLSKNEMAEYLAHRLAVAGVERPLFTGSAVTRLYRLSGGVPRLINLLSDRALLGAYVKGRNVVTPALVRAAAGEVFGKRDGMKRSPHTALQWLLTATLLLFLVTCAVLLYLMLKMPVTADSIAETEGAPRIAHVVKPKVEDEPIRWTSGEEAERSTSLAYQALFRLWGQDPVDLEQGARQLAAGLGLELLANRGSLGRIMQLNRPVVLKLSAPQQDDFFVTLVGLDEDTATLIIGSDLHRVPLTRLSSQWLGEYGLLWQPPPGYTDAVKPGESGVVVDWLEQRMALLSGRAVRTGEELRLNGRLLEELLEFQANAGIKADGILGPFTLIMLNTRTGGDQPTLYTE